MYINPFIAGILVTIMTEIILIMATALTTHINKRNNGGKK